MKAEDSVMNRQEKKRLIVERSHQQTVGETQEDMLLNKQAEISFKAGYDKRESEFVYNPDYLDFQKGVVEGRKLGRKEVAEWLLDRLERYKVAPKLIGFTMLSEEWQEQLKKWEVE